MFFVVFAIGAAVGYGVLGEGINHWWVVTLYFGGLSGLAAYVHERTSRK